MLFIGLVWPEPTSSAAGKRILQLVEFFLNRGDEVIFSSAASKSEASFDFSTFCHSEPKCNEGEESLDSSYLGMTNDSFHNCHSDEGGIFIKEIPIKLNDSSFNEFVKKLNPEIVVFDRFVTEEQFGWRVTQECPNALQILDTEDLHFLRSAREKAFKKKEEIHLYNETAIREIASILRCDLSLIIAEFEMNLLQNEFNIAPSLLHYLPFLENVCHSEVRGISNHQSNEISPLHSVSVEMTKGIVSDKLQTNSTKQLKTYEERKDFVFIGNFLHEPNWQTVLHLKKNIWKKIKSRLPKANLHIYGAYPSQKVWDLHNEKEGFMVHGKADDALRVISDARILLAPILFGAGQKGKFIDAMTVGTPIATTLVGAESMFDDEMPGISENDENEFIKKTIELYQNKEIWVKAQNTGLKILRAKFDKKLFEKEFNQKIINLQSELTVHRNRNFVGQILKSNSVNTLKYMSLWIEEKNSK